MKKICLFTCFFIGFHLAVLAQDIISSFLDKHEKDDNLEIVSIGKKMMESIGALSSDNPDFAEAIKGLETIRIVSSKDQDLNKDYFLSAQALLSKTKGLKNYFTINEENKELIVMIRESKGCIKELILLSEQPDGFNLISLSGTINLDDMQKYSEGLNIKELNQLSSVKHNQ